MQNSVTETGPSGETSIGRGGAQESRQRLRSTCVGDAVDALRDSSPIPRSDSNSIEVEPERIGKPAMPRLRRR